MAVDVNVSIFDHSRNYRSDWIIWNYAHFVLDNILYCVGGDVKHCSINHFVF